MDGRISQEEKEEIIRSFSNPSFSLEHEIQKLMIQGFEENEAKEILMKLFREYKRKLANTAIKEKNYQDMKIFFFTIIVMISIAGPIFTIDSILWYIFATIIVGFMGFKSHKNKPLAGLFSYICLPIIFPFTYAYYFADRTTFIRIELAIPLLFAVLPVFVVYYLISKIAYTDN